MSKKNAEKQVALASPALKRLVIRFFSGIQWRLAGLGAMLLVLI